MSKGRNGFCFFLVFDTHTAPLLETINLQCLRRQIVASKNCFDMNSFVFDPLTEVKIFRKKSRKALNIEESRH